MVDVTVSDQDLSDEHREWLEQLTRSPLPGWEHRDSWKVGSIGYHRFTWLTEQASLSEVCRYYADEADKHRVRGVPITASMCIRDVRYDWDVLLPYRYQKPRPRGRVRSDT